MDNEEIIKNEEKQAEEAVKKVLEKNQKVKAAKNAIEEGKRRIKKGSKKYILIGSIVLVIALACFAGTMKIVNTMQELLNGITSVGNFIQEAWQWIRDDYWIKLDKKVEYVVDINTGETLGLKELVTDDDYKDEDGNQRETTIEEYTLVDKYVKELGNQGLSLKALRLLGDADYSDEDALLQDEDNKKLVEKYIAEFVRADIITQQPHRRRGKDLVQKGNENNIDGGVYFYRTKIDEGASEEQFTEGEFSEEVELSENDYVQMEFIEYDKFQEGLSQNDKDLIYKFSIDDDGQIVIAEVKITTTKSSDTPLSGWLGDIDAWCQQQANKSEVYELSEIKVDYKSLISKYSMPYEFLVNLCQITQNPEFVYHVALLARDTKINLVVLDNGTTVREITDGESIVEEYKNYDNDSFSGATKVSSETKQTRSVQTTSTHTPVLKIDYANTWSFYEKFSYNKKVIGTITDGALVQQTNSNFPPSDDKLHNFHEAEPFEGQAVIDDDQFKNYWYEKFTVQSKSQTRVTELTTEYLGGDAPSISVEKSKQFLGLLINKTGECTEENCDEITDLVSQEPKALKCAENAVFERTLGKGYYVRYRIPNMTRFEAPYNRLTSDIQKLYASLQSNSTGYNERSKIELGEGENVNDKIDEYIANNDTESAYVVKMQGLVEHIRYLMTLPENEEYEEPCEQDEEDEVDVEEPKVEYEDNISQEDLELLYRLCEAEAGGSRSKLEIGHVACVVLNRVKCSTWPNTIEGVIYDRNQFACVRNGSIDRVNPSDITKEAVNSIVSGSDTTGGAVYFRTHASAASARMPLTAGEKHSTYIYLFEDPITTHIFYTDQKSLEELRGASGGTSPATGKLADVFPDGIPTTREEIQKYLVTIQVPITTKRGNKTTTSLTIHKDVADQVKNVLQQAQNAGFKVYEIGGFSWRRISGSTKMSQHSLGLAVDINVNENYCVYPNGKVDAGSFWDPSRSEYSISRNGALYNAFKAIGWGWGGDWSSKKDYMHFSYTGG